MIQLMDILNDLTLFTFRNKADNKEIICWLAQNERTLAVYGEGCVDDRTVMLNANLNHNVSNNVQNLASKYGVDLNNENYYKLRAEITACKAEE